MAMVISDRSRTCASPLRDPGVSIENGSHGGGSLSCVTLSAAVGLSSRTSATNFWKGYKALWHVASVLRHIFVPSSYADRPTKNELETYAWGSVLARTTKGDRGPPIERASVSSNVVLGGSEVSSLSSALYSIWPLWLSSAMNPQ